MRLVAAISGHSLILLVLLRLVGGWWLPVAMGVAGSATYYLYPPRFRRVGLAAWMLLWFGIPLAATILQKTLASRETGAWGAPRPGR